METRKAVRSMLDKHSKITGAGEESHRKMGPRKQRTHSGETVSGTGHIFKNQSPTLSP